MAWDDVYLTPDGGQSGSPAPPRVSLPPAYDESLSIVPGYAGDNTRPPKPKGVMDTTFHSLPSTANPDGGSEWERVGNAAYDAWQASQPPGDNNSWVHNPIGKLLGVGFGAPAALGAGVGQGVTDAARGLGVPERAIRDIPFLSGAVTSVLPQFGEASGYTRTAPPPASPPSPMWRSPEAGPRYAPPQIVPGGGATVADVQRVQQAQAARQPPGVPIQRPFVPSSQTDIAPPMAPPSASEPPANLQEGRARTAAHYAIADQNADTAAVTPAYGTEGLDAAIKQLQPKGPMSTDPSSPLNRIAVRLSNARDQPITLGDYDANDKMLTGSRGEQMAAGNLNNARIIQGVQADLREHFEGAGPGDVTGGQEGYDALDPARKSNTQTQKWQDIEDMIYRSSLPGSSPNAMRNELKSYLGGDASRNLTPTERAAYTSAMDLGPLGNAAKLVARVSSPLVGSVLGGTTGLLGAEGVRFGAGALRDAFARARVQNAVDVLRKGYPPAPTPFSLPSGQP